MKFGPLASPPESANRIFAAWNNGGNYDVCVGVVLARMAVLTVFRGNELRRRADENRILIRKIPAPGIILTATVRH